MLLILRISLFLAISFLSLEGKSFAQSSSEPAHSVDRVQLGYGAIADILESEAERDALISDLRRLASAELSEVDANLPDESTVRKIARVTKEIVADTVLEIRSLYDRILALRMAGLPSEKLAKLFDTFLDLGILVVVAVGSFLASNLLMAAVYHKASEWVPVPGRLHSRQKRWIAGMGCSVLGIVLVVFGCIVGYIVALFIIGDGSVTLNEALFLNAFLVIEVVKVLIRQVFITRYESLRILPISGDEAVYWKLWLLRFVNLLGYGLLIVVPIVKINLGSELGFLIEDLVFALAFIFSVVLIRQIREQVRDLLLDWATNSSMKFANILLRPLAYFWHIVVIVYLSLLTLLFVYEPDQALSLAGGATGETVIAIAGGVLLSTLINKAITMGVRLTPQMRLQFPLMEERLNAFVPATLKVVRVVIVLVVMGTLLDAWHIFSFFAWMDSDTGLAVIGRLLTAAMVMTAAFFIWLFVSSWIEYQLARPGNGSQRVSKARQNTLLAIFRNAFTVIIAVMALMITLSEIGIDIGPLLAGAGVLSFAIGFGAQKLVQDVITGIFIQLENAIYTGDVVTVSGLTGVVEKLTIRSLGIRDLSGTYHFVPFSSVDTVSNFMRGFAYHVGEYGVGYGENIDEVIEVMKQAFDELVENQEHAANILGDLEVHGVTSFAESSVNVRVRIKTRPGQQWGIGRAFNLLIKTHFDAAGIGFPYPHVTLSFGEDKKGDVLSAPNRS